MATDPEERSGGWEHRTWNSERNPDWQVRLSEFLNAYKPAIEDVHGSISLGVDVHIWLKPGVNDRQMYVDKIPANDVVRGVKQMLTDRGGVEIGFNKPSPATDPVMWIVTYTDPRSSKQT